MSEEIKQMNKIGIWIFIWVLSAGSCAWGGHLLVDLNGIGGGDISEPNIVTYQGTALLDRSLPETTWWNGLQITSANTIDSYFHGPDDPNFLYYADGTKATGITITLSDWQWQDRTLGGGETFNALLKDYIGSDHTSYITVGGLTPGQAYDVVGYSSNGPDGLGAYWTANGVGPVDLTLGVANVGVMRGAVADGEGKIVISCDHDPLPAAPLTIVNGFEIKEAAALPANTSYLTEIGLTRAINENGGMDVRERYNTFWYDGAWSVVVYEGAFDPNGIDPNEMCVNYPVDYSVNIPLTAGEEKTFHFYFSRANPDGYLEAPYWGMNFFFNDQQYMSPARAGISVLADMDETNANDGHPAFVANSNASTMGYPYDPAIPGSGSLVFYDAEADTSITLTDFFVYYQNVWNADMIRRDDWLGDGPPTPGPDGWIDCVGQFTLKVEAYVPTCNEAGIYVPQDLNQDCYVDLADLAILAGQWLKCNDQWNPDCTM